MATIYKNDKGFRIIKIHSQEIITTIGGLGICDNCEKAHIGFGYLIPVMNRWFCPDCFKEWYEKATRFEEDNAFEESIFKEYCSRLKLTY